MNGDFYNGFSADIKNHMQTMEVAWNGTTLNDKVKLLSVTELDAQAEQGKYIYEGIKYPVYYPFFKNVDYFTRSRVTNSGVYVWTQMANGQCLAKDYYNSYSCICAIQLGQSLS